ncbi:MAG TPA: DUF5132 domain-containing protein [Desulfomonilaceae bacterium]|nr:DUF5132 domain-containing protein [Desulfomonilaceae bacterium]
MALSDLRPKGDIWTGVAVGVGLLLAPVVLPMIAAAVKPVAKTAIKYGYMIYEKGTEMLAEVTEVVEDLAAEAKAEVQTELASAREKEV